MTQRYGSERATDLEHLCLVCHGREHPNHTFRTVAEQRRIAASRGKTVRGRMGNPKGDGLTREERRALQGNGSWAWRPPE